MQKSFYAALALILSLTSAVSIKEDWGWEPIPAEQPQEPARTCTYYYGWVNGDGFVYETKEHCEYALSLGF